MSSASSAIGNPVVSCRPSPELHQRTLSPGLVSTGHRILRVPRYRSVPGIRAARHLGGRSHAGDVSGRFVDTAPLRAGDRELSVEARHPDDRLSVEL